jgi:hypothetical protein
MKGKTELLTNFKLFFLSQLWKYCRKNFKVYAILFFLKIVKIKPANKVQSYFLERDAFSASRTSLFISITSLIGVE